MTALTRRIRSLVIAGLSLLPLLSIAQTAKDYYDTQWTVVDSMLNKSGLPVSALTRINTIYTRAKQEKNDVQIIKTLMYRLNIREMNYEDSVPAGIEALNKEIDVAQQPARSILQSIQADQYWNYFKRNRYKIYQRTATAGVVKNDISTWGTADFHKRIGDLFLASIREEKLLQGVKLAAYDPILFKGNTRTLRPTLFDLLAHYALNYFKTDEQDLERPAYAFEIDDPAVFADAAAFANHSFKTSDSLSLHFTALLLFQRLIRFHASDPTPAALLDLDIERLNFVLGYSVADNKEELYEKALARITDRYSSDPAAAEAWYFQAQQYANRADKYDPLKDTSNRYANITAIAICKKVLAEKEPSEGKSNCIILLKSIQRKTLQLQAEKVNLPGLPFRSLVSWRNVSNLHFRIIQLNHDTRESLGRNQYQDGWWKKIVQLPVLKSFTRDLPATNDYQDHRVEIAVDALPVGEYAIIASADSAFTLANNPLAVEFFYISAIAFLRNGNDYFVLDRGSGQPLPGANVQVWDRSFDNKTATIIMTRAETYRADAQGHFRLKARTNRHNTLQRLEIRTGSDHLFIDDEISSYAEDETPSDDDNLAKTSFLFTDRSIYRPGQVVFFKGIVINRYLNKKGSTILPGFQTKLILYDANRTKVDSLLLTTNEFGSYKGQFRLPENLLNGQFTIADDSTGNEATVSVEEYKRPKFYVEYDKVKGSHRVGDTLRINGTAKAYAGNNIDGALVKYRVVRQARYPMYYSWRRPVAVSGQEIAHGETRTDAAGAFSILFTALPDRTSPENADPVFEYTVSADITDLNGETRSGQTIARVGYTAMELSFPNGPDDRLPADSLTRLTVKAANLSGEPVPALVTLSVYPLQAPDRLIRARYWEQPDQFTMNREEYLRNFPHDDYSDELNEKTWAKKEKLFETTDSAGKSVTLQLPAGKKWLPGWYLIEARSKDRYGRAVKNIKYVSLYDGKTGAPANPQYNWATEEQQTIQPGETAKLGIGSSANDVYIIRKLEKTGDKTSSPFQFLTLNGDRRTTGFPITEDDRGGFGITDVFVKDNRVYTNIHTVLVLWTNKELSIHYGSFRDKTLPGSEEKWTLHLAGYKADKVVAEVLAGMYDASLDQFQPHGWAPPDIYPLFGGGRSWERGSGFSAIGSQQRYEGDPYPDQFDKRYDALLFADDMQAYGRITMRGAKPMYNVAPMTALEGRVAGLRISSAKAPATNFAHEPPTFKAALADDVTMAADTVAYKDAGLPASTPQSPIQIRKNFNETAFFFPDLRTDSDGNLELAFTMPEALTKWKMMLLAHTRDLSFGYSEKTVVTQKQLMVQPNMPRFLREGDRLELPVKVVNLTDSEMTGQMQLELTDPTTGKTADGLFTNRQPNQYFTVGAGQSVVVGFPIDVPFQYNRPLTYRVTARAREYSDGEEAILPIVSNRMLVTESLPLNMSGDGTRTFKFDKLLQSGNSETLSHHALTVEFTSNPAWYAVQALPYLMEFPYECAEQTFNRFYANALASTIVSSSPRIQEIFQRWKTLDTAALLSNLEKDQELKSVLLQETPWVLQGKSESQQKKNIALLFDMARMSGQLEATLAKLTDMQGPNGGFVWFKGGPDDRYITQYILTGIGHLQQLKALPPALAGKIKTIVAAALPYLDQKIKSEYADLLRQEKNRQATGSNTASTGKTPVSTGKKTPTGKPSSVAAAGKIRGIGELPVQYLYMRSLFPDNGIPGDVFPAVNYFRKQAQQSWLQYGKFVQGMIALSLYRTGDVQTAKNIMASLRENAIRDSEKGMYWKGMEGGYYWYESPIETESLLIEAFHTISPDAGIERDCRTWLLKQKQTHNWATTRATADACYALLLGGNDWLSAERDINIQLGDKTAASATTVAPAAEAGTGYFKKIFDGPFVNPSMGNITVTMSTKGTTGDRQKSSQPAWGAVYWQYFENLDRITAANGNRAPLKLVKKLFITRNTDRGPVLEPVLENGVLKPGDKITVRIELQSDRNLEYVHMKDMRASCMEPVNVLSEYKWQGGLGYYESTKDVSTEFFFSNLPKGTYVFEYPLFVGQAGNFSNGVTSIECMYAPEFSFHSEGIRVNVEP